LVPLLRRAGVGKVEFLGAFVSVCWLPTKVKQGLQVFIIDTFLMSFRDV
jgi:hypothetical protein